MINVTLSKAQLRHAQLINAQARHKADPSQNTTLDALGFALATILDSEGVSNYSPAALERYIQDALSRAFARRECPGKLLATELIKDALSRVDYVDLAVRLSSIHPKS